MDPGGRNEWAADRAATTRALALVSRQLIDAAASEELAAVVRQAGLGPWRRAVVDFSEATFLGVAALNFLAGLTRSCDTVGLVGTEAQPLLPRMLTAVGLNLDAVHLS